ncbi:MAG TPA: MerR family transcriptional regulator [Anaerolineales bacterium]|jgi:DNA-binding transcriptional MerR regulator|nr:MerR family transcriptional regulator [Anaerolineales bacterium]
MAMQIQDLAHRTGVSAKAIRYYESIDLLPSPKRRPNGYREYGQADVERLKLVAGARNLDFSLGDIEEILALRDRREAPCRVVLRLLEEKTGQIRERITQLQKLEVQLRQLSAVGLTFPTDDVDGKNCVCHLVSIRAEASTA